jgi:hypothetical protein
LAPEVFIKADHIYVFVLLNKPGEAVRYFIVPGSVLKNEVERFGKDFPHPTMPGIHHSLLKQSVDKSHAREQNLVRPKFGTISNR